MSYIGLVAVVLIFSEKEMFKTMVFVDKSAMFKAAIIFCLGGGREQFARAFIVISDKLDLEVGE